MRRGTSSRVIDAMVGLAARGRPLASPVHVPKRVWSGASTSQAVVRGIPKRIESGSSRCFSSSASRRRGIRTNATSSSSPDPDSFAFGTLGTPGCPGEGSAHQIAALVSWLAENGVSFGDRAKFCKVRGMGVGGVATRELRQGDVIFSLPMFAANKKEGDGDERIPLVMTTRVVMSHTGPLGRLGRALSAAGLTTREKYAADESARPGMRSDDAGDDESNCDKQNEKCLVEKLTEKRRNPTHRLGGVHESDLPFPLDVSSTTLLALGLLFTCARAQTQTPTKNPEAHWVSYTNLLPRETDALLEWSDSELQNLRGSKLVTRALERRTLVHKVFCDVFPVLLDVDPGLFLPSSNVSSKSSNKVSSESSSNFSSPAAFRWAFSTVLARAFTLPVGECGAQKELGLCPGLDLFNHDDDAEQCVVEGFMSEDEDEDDAFAVIDSQTAKNEMMAEYFRAADSDDETFDADETRLAKFGNRVTLRAGAGGAEDGAQLFHRYADRGCGESLLEFGFVNALGGTRAADVSLMPLLLSLEHNKRNKRLQMLAGNNLCAGFSWEVTDAALPGVNGWVGMTLDATNNIRGTECVPLDALRVARVLTLNESEFDAINSWDDAAAEAYDGATCFSNAHEQRFGKAMAGLFLREREALDVMTVHGEVSRAKGVSNEVEQHGSGRSNRRRLMARKVVEGEQTLLQEISNDFLRTTNEKTSSSHQG